MQYIQIIWAFTQAVAGLVVALNLAFDWIEPCTCHWHRDFRLASKELKDLWCACPMRNRRCPELAAGDLQRDFQAALSLSASRLALELKPNLDVADRLTILQEFEAPSYPWQQPSSEQLSYT